MSADRYQLTVDGKTYDVSKENIDNFGWDRYAKDYPGATVYMQDEKGEAFDMPLDRADFFSKHGFTFHTPEPKEKQEKPGQVEHQDFSVSFVPEGMSQDTVHMPEPTASDPPIPIISEEKQRVIDETERAKKAGVPMFNDAPNPPIGKEDVERGLWKGIKKGSKVLGYGLQSLMGEAANLVTGSSLDDTAALGEIARREALGIDVRFESAAQEKAWNEYQKVLKNPNKTDAEKKQAGQQYLRSQSKNVMHISDGGQQIIPVDRNEYNELREKKYDDKTAKNILLNRWHASGHVRTALQKTGGDVDKAKELLKAGASKSTWGDKQIDSAMEKMGQLKPTAGFGAWVGELIPQIGLAAVGMGVGAATKNPKAAQIAGRIGMGAMVASSAGGAMSEAREYGATNAQVWTDGLANGIVEYVTERIPFSRYTGRVVNAFKSKAAKTLGETLATNPTAIKELNELIGRANKTLGGKLLSGKNLTDFMADMFAESASEFTAEGLQTISSMIYENPEDYPTLAEVINSGLQGAAGGAFMGGILGGASKAIEHGTHTTRRKQQGYVDIAVVQQKEGKGAGKIDVVEILGKDDKGEIIVLQDGEPRPVHEENIINSTRFPYKDFRKGRIELESEASYENGYSLTAQQERRDAKNALDYQRERMRKALGIDDISVDGLLNWDDLPLDDNERQTALDYINAKSNYEGMIRRVKDDMDGLVEEKNALVEECKSRDDGMVHSATMKVDERQVYIINGSVVMTEDGKAVNIGKSGKEILIKDAETGKVEMVSPSAILKVGEVVDAEALKKAIADKIREGFARNAANEIDGILSFKDGDTYTLTTPKGDHFSVQVVAGENGATIIPGQSVVDDDGELHTSPDMVNVVINGATADGWPVISQMPKEQIQDMFRATESARIEEVERLKKNILHPSEDSFHAEDSVVLIDKEGNEIYATILTEADADGKYEVYTETPIAGKKVNLFTREELDGMVSERNGQPVTPHAAESLANNTESGPTGTVAPDNRTDLPQNGTEAAPSGTTALSRIPVDENNVPQFEQAPLKEGWDALMELNEGNEQDTIDMANDMIANAQGELAKAQKQKPKGTNPIEIKQSRDEIRANIATLQKKVDYWTNIAGYPNFLAEREAEMAAAMKEEENEAMREPESIGNNRFGNIYQWVTGKLKEAADFLTNLKSGYLRGVFHREGFGDIDMIWGDEKAGLQHIIKSHIEEADDFESVDDALEIIDDVIKNGEESQQGTNISFAKDGYRVSIAQSDEGKWVLTAFDTTRTRKKKKRSKGDSTIGDQEISDAKNGTLVSPQLDSDNKGNEIPEENKTPAENPIDYSLSDEVDENGRQFVLNPQGEIAFGEISAESGLIAAPILLSEGTITNNATNDGYGLVHIEARHGEQIRKAGYKSVIDFISEVAKNYEVIRKGKERDGIQTYMLQLTDKHNNTLMVELSGDGNYWNVNTAGIFKTSYGAKNNVVYDRHTTEKQSAETVEASLEGEQSGTTPSTGMNAPAQLSDNKGSEIPEENNTTSENRVVMAEEEGISSNTDTIDKAIANATASLTEDEGERHVAAMESMATQAPTEEFSRDNYDALFPNGRIDTPIGSIKLGENQFEKLRSKGRQEQLGMMSETLRDPDVVLYEEDLAAPEDTERSGVLLFIKTFTKEDGSKYTNFESVTIRKDGEEIAISNHILGRNAYKGKLESDQVVYKKASGNSSERHLTKQEEPVPDLVPTQPDALSDSKGNEIFEENNIYAESPVVGSIETTRQEVDTEPTEAQKKAGNYKKGHVKIDGHDITIENPKGSVRSGTSADGTQWETEMHNDYGYIRGTQSIDGDHIDVFLSDNPTEGNVFVIDQVNPETGEFDEHKVMYGFGSEQEAKEAYLSNYEKGWKGLGSITAVSKDEFRKWIDRSHRKTKPFAEYKSVKPVEAAKQSQAFDRQVPETLEKARSIISRLVDIARTVNNRVERAVIGGITERQRQDFAKKYIDVNDNFVHSIENSAILHNQKEHGNPQIEEARGQIAIKEADYSLIPDILYEYDTVEKSPRKNKQGRDVVIYTKQYPDGTIYYLEEVRESRESLAFLTMYKKKNGFGSSDGLLQDAAPSTSMTPSDNSVSVSESKGSEISGENKPTQTSRPVKRNGEGEGKIQDFGEKIGGARKDLAQEYRKRLSDVKDEDLRVLPLSKIFPRPNLKAMVEEGNLTQDNALAIYYIYGEIPAKPRKQYKLERWLRQVKATMETVETILQKNGEINAIDTIRKRLATKNAGYYYLVNGEEVEVTKEQREDLNDELMKLKVLKDLGFPTSGVAPGNASIKYSIHSGEKYDVSVNGRIARFEKYDEALDYLKRELMNPSKKETVFNVYINRQTGKCFVGKPIQGKEPVCLSEKFDTGREAREYLRDHRAEVQLKWEALHVNPEERRSENRERAGRDWREGKDVTPEMFKDTFGFRGTEFGNWVNQRERHDALNSAYDALMDLSSVLGISPKSLSLNGELGMAFGARGTGNAGGSTAAAHYEPNKVVINLTKTKGAGSLAHEWWHALDNYFSRAGGKSLDYATKSTAGLDGKVRKEMKDAFESLMKAIRTSGLPERSKALDKTKSKDYWSTDIEMSARSFESYVASLIAEKGDSNDYLVNFKEMDEWIKSGMFAEDTYPYPTAEESHSVNEKFRQFFDTIQEKKDEETGNSVLFHVMDDILTEYGGEAGELATKVAENLVRATGIKVETVSDAEALAKLDNMDVARLNARQKKALETASPAKRDHQTVVSSAHGTNIIKNIDDAIIEYENVKGNKPNTFIGDVAKALSARRHGSGSEYATFETVNGRIVTIRIANHNGKVSTFDNHGENDGISIVITPKDNDKLMNDGNAHIVEFYYDAVKLRRADGKPLAEILKSIKQALYSGEYKDTTGLAEREEVNIPAAQFLRDGEGAVYGWTEGGKIYLNRDKLNPETPIHEYTHLWFEGLRVANPELYKRGIELMRALPIWEEVRTDRAYSTLTDEHEVASECLSRLTGRKGADVLTNITEEVLKKKGIFEQAEVIYTVHEFKDWLKQFWTWVKNAFTPWSREEAAKVSAEDISNMVLSDLVRGINPNEVTSERERIVERTKADGTYMKAPNGKPTNLIEKQWIQVRTKAFKEWFGDWEKATRIEKLRDSKTVEITGEEYKGKYELNRKDARKWALENLRNEYLIKDTGEKVKLSRVSVNEITSHGEREIIHLKSFAFIPQMLENAIFIEEATNLKGNSKYDSYRYYVVGLDVAGEPYTARMVVGVKNGNTYYDHELTQIEKGNLINSLNSTTTTVAENEITSSTHKDKKLFSLLQTNSSKVVDENGEPRVVYHGTENGGFTIFDGKKGEGKGFVSGTNFFSSSKKVADGYSISRIIRKGEQKDGTPLDFEEARRELEQFAEKGYYGYRDKQTGQQIADSFGKTKEDSDKALARALGRYYRKENSELYECFVNIRNPYIAQSKGWRALVDEIKSYSSQDFWDAGIDELKKLGYDGIVAKDISDSSIDIRHDIATDYVAFFSNQIKSATDNVGSFDKNEEDIRFHHNIDAINERFNKELDAFKAGNHNGLLHLGPTGEVLQASGVNAKELTLSPRVLNRKLKEHGLTTDELKGLAKGLQSPILVYKHGENHPNMVVVTEIEVKGGKLSASLEIDADGNVVEVNNISSIHSKDASIELNRLSSLSEDELKEALRWVEKEKVLGWLNIAPLNEGSHADNPKLISVTNIIKDFKNPSIEEEIGLDKEGNNLEAANYTDSQTERISFAAESIAHQLGTKVRVIHDVKDIKHKSADAQRRLQNAKGWYDMESGEVVVVAPNHQYEQDARATVFHESIGQRGVEEIVGEDNFKEFLMRIFTYTDESTRKNITNLSKKYGWDIFPATEEYLAELVESEQGIKANSPLWENIRDFFESMVNEAGLALGFNISDTDLRYALWRNRHRKNNKGAMAMAEDIAMRQKMHVGNFSDNEVRFRKEVYDLDAVNERFNEQLAELTEENARSKILSLGIPSEALLSAGVSDKPIKLYGSKLLSKAQKHGFHFADLANLPEAVADPIAVFNGSVPNSFAIITELRLKDHNVLVSLSLGKDNDIDFNLVRSVYGKANIGIIDWIIKGKLQYVDKEKALEYLRISAPIAEAQDTQELSSAANIIKDFKNPSIEGKIRFHRVDTTESALRRVQARQQYEKTLSTSTYQMREAFQDSMLGLQTLMQSILKAEGKGMVHIEDVDAFENAYIEENRLSSINSAEIAEYKRDILTPLMKAVVALGVTSEQVYEYLMAKHGLERNRLMAERDAIKASKEDQAKTYEEHLDEARKRDYSGLTALTGTVSNKDAEEKAKQLVAEFEAAHDTKELWMRINAATKSSLAKLKDSGLLSKEGYESISKMYQYYVPLRGWDEATSDQVYGYLAGGKGFLNSPLKKAEGRSSRADNPLAYIDSMAETAIMQGNRNKMKQKFLNFALNHPSDLVSVNDIWLAFDEVTGEWTAKFASLDAQDSGEVVQKKIEEFNKEMAALAKRNPTLYKHGSEAISIPFKVVEGSLKEHQVLVKRNGKTYVLTINGNPRAAHALNGLTNPDTQINGVWKEAISSVKTVNRFLSNAYTTANIEFIASNFVRDLTFSNTMVWVKESPEYALRFHRHYAQFNPATMVSLFHKLEAGTLNESNTTEKLFKQFIQGGGETGYTAIKNIEKKKKELEKRIAKYKNKGGIGDSVEFLGAVLDIMNRSVENSARFAAFVTSRELGRTMERSIYDAKEITVNFNKKGAGSRYWSAPDQTYFGKMASGVSELGSAAFIFWNVGIQGLANYGRAAKRHPIKALAAAATMFISGALTSYINGYIFFDEDDKDAYYDLPEYVRRSNICIRIGKETWLTIPLAVDFRPFYGLGELAMGVISGKERYSDEELAFHIASQVSQILPLDMLEGGGGLHGFIPSVLKPAIEVKENKSWSGLPIYREAKSSKDEHMPNWARAYPSADRYIVGATKKLNELAGGDDYYAPWKLTDLNPAAIEYLLNGYFGGYVKTVSKFVKMVETGSGKRDFEWRNMLIASRFLRTADERTKYRKLNNEYYKIQKEVGGIAVRLNGYDDRKEDPQYAKLLEELKKSPEYDVYEIFDEYRGVIDDIKEEMNYETDPEKHKELEALRYEKIREMVDKVRETKAKKKEGKKAG